MTERLDLVSMFVTGQYRVAELAEYFGVSRKTAYKWLAQFAEEGVEGLEERSRAPHSHPNATPAVVEMSVLRAKAAHPRWGPAKLSRRVGTWPATSTRGKILARHGLVTPRRRRRRVAPWSQPFQDCDGPNAVWCADFKGWVRTGDGRRCDPLTISDAFSRMLLCCDIVAKPDYDHVRPACERTFREHGLPLAIRTDNGPPFASVGVVPIYRDPPCRCGGSSWGSGQSAFSRDTPSKTAGTNVCTAPSSKRPCARLRPTRRSNRSGVTSFAWPTTLSGPIRRWAKCHRLPSMCRRPVPTPSELTPHSIRRWLSCDGYGLTGKSSGTVNWSL